MNLAMDLIREALLGSDGGGGGGGGGDSFELVYSKDYEINQSSSTAITVDTIALTNTLKTFDKVTYVEARDKAGKRASHFYRSDIYAYWYSTAIGPSRIGIHTSSNASNYYAVSTTVENGVYPVFSDDGKTVTINAKKGTGMQIIDGTISVKIYQASLPGGTIFE